MKFKKIGSTYLIRLEKDERIIERLSGLCEKEKIKGGYFFGLGALSELELGHFNLATQKYSSKKFSGEYEVVSLNGNVSSLDGRIYIHAHIVVGDSEFQSWSGHLKEATVSATCEIYLIKLDEDVRRKRDEKTGLNLLDV